MKLASLITAIVLVTPLTASEQARIRLGPLESEYDAAKMTIEPFDHGLVLDDGRPWTRTAAYVEVSEAEPCSPEAMRAALGDRGDDRRDAGSRVLASGLTLNWATTWTGCRALTGRPIAACVRHEGVTTRVRGLDLGCETPIDQDMLILTLMAGLRPAGAVPESG